MNQAPHHHGHETNVHAGSAWIPWGWERWWDRGGECPTIEEGEAVTAR